VILNFVAINTNEGRVLAKLLDRLCEIRKDLGTDQVFDVVGEIFPGNPLEKLFRDLYTRKTNVPDDGTLPDKTWVEQFLLEQALQPFLAEVSRR